MMYGSLTRVLVERERLRARIETQRRDVGRHVRRLSAPAALIDKVRLAVRFVRAHPAVMLAGGAVALALRPRSVFALVARGVGIWRLATRTRMLLRRVGY